MKEEMEEKIKDLYDEVCELAYELKDKDLKQVEYYLRIALEILEK